MSHRNFAAEVDDVLSRALERERAQGDPGRAFQVLCDRVGAGLRRWIGVDGWDALLARARLDAAPPDAEDAEDAELRVLCAVAVILSRLIGPELTLRLVEQACQHPDDAPAGGRNG